MDEQRTEVRADAATFEREVRSEMDRLRELRTRDPFINPILLLALNLKRRVESGDATEAMLDRLLDNLKLEAALNRARILRNYMGEVARPANDAKLDGLFAELPDDFDGFRAIVEHPLYGFVFTAHPTFGHNRALQADLVNLALRVDADGAPLDATAQSALVQRLATTEHRAPQPIDLNHEHKESLAAIDTLQSAVTAAHRRLLDLAKQRYPDRWRELRPSLVSIATWVGYDLDGRADIPWRLSFAKRLDVQAAQLRAYLGVVQALRSKAEGEPTVAESMELLEARLSLALKTNKDMVQAMLDNDGDDHGLGRLAEISRAQTTSDSRPVVSVGPLLAVVERALAAAADEDLAVELCLLASSMRANGLASAQSHVRINAVQIHNAVRKQVGLDHPVDDPSYRQSYLAKIGALIDEVEPSSIHFGVVNVEKTTARRIFMVITQLLKFVDSDEPIRFLIAETDSAFTVLAALYFAKLFGIDDRIDISPLFETEKALDRGVAVVQEALAQPAYRDYVKKRGRICLQTGYSDAGRYLGQTAAAVMIERLRLDLARVLTDAGLNDIEVVIFDTHGESIGRGCHPASMADRLAYTQTPESRRRFAEVGLRCKEENSFQGGDGYLMFLHADSAYAVLTRVLEQVLTPPESEPDPFYSDTVYTQEFFSIVRRYNSALIDNPDYAALLGAFGTNMLEPSGSRAVRRQHDGSGPLNLEHPSQLRAIPHNAILQQLGFLANTIGGVGAAVAKDPERFGELYAQSDRFKRLIGMVEHAFKFSDPAVLRAYIDLLDPGMWLLRSARVDDPQRREELLEVSDLLDRYNMHPRLDRVFLVLMRDYLSLDDGLRRHRRSRREMGEEPIAIDSPTRDNMHLLNALRLASILRLFAISTRIPEFSGRHERTRDEVQTLIIHLDVESSLGLLRRIFPYAERGQPGLDWGEDATYADADGQSYRLEHEEIFQPLERLSSRVRSISAALIHHVRALG